MIEEYLENTGNPIEKDVLPGQRAAQMYTKMSAEFRYAAPTPE